MKFDFFKKKGQTGSDCECGCTEKARDSVRLTDLEIAEDIIGELSELEKEYECLCNEGCDCEKKLESCCESKKRLGEFVKECKGK